MLLLRGLGASLLWIAAGVVGLLGVILCATVILIPLGIPVLMLAKRLFMYSMSVLVPGKVKHPVETLERTAGKRSREAAVSPASTRRQANRMAKRLRRDSHSLTT